MSLPAWGAWIEMSAYDLSQKAEMSLPAWGAWIEILVLYNFLSKSSVAPRMGSVD